MMLDMLHNQIEILVGRAEAHKLGPHNARKLMSLIRQMADAERAQGVAQGRAEEREETRQKFEEMAARLKAAAARGPKQ